MRFGFYAGDTSKTIYVRLRDSTTGLAKTGLAYNSAGAVASYTLPLAARAAITLATQTVTGAYSSGGFVEVDATNAKGLYRFDLPNAAIASGDFSIISIQFTGVIEESIEIELFTPKANVTQLLGTAWLTPGTAGTPDVNVKLWNALTTVALPLVPTTAGRTLDVSAGGEAGIDWANVGSPTTVVGLSGTTVKTATDVETDTADIQTRIPAALVGGRIDSNVGALGGTVQSATDLKDFADTGYNPVTHYIAGIEGTLNQFDDLNNAITAPTAAQNRAEMDANSTKLSDILTDTGTTLDGRIPAALTADGNMKADTLRVNGTAQTAGDIAALINALALYTTRVVGRGTAAGASTTSITTSAFTPAGIATDQFKGRIIIFDVNTATTALRGQATDITASTISATPTFTVTALTTAPAAGDTFTVV